MAGENSACDPRELSQSQKMLQQPDFGYITNCRSRIPFKLQQNRPAANLCWSIWLFNFSDLCRPVLNQESGQRCWHFDCAGSSRWQVAFASVLSVRCLTSN